MSARRAVTAAVILIIVAVGVAIGRSGNDSPAVTTTRVERVEALQSLVAASGEIVAARYADIGANTMGRIVALTVKEGDRVKEGDVLARIDAVQATAAATGADAALAALEADARAAKTQERAAQGGLDEVRARAGEAATALQRARQLRDGGLMPAADFDRAQAAAAGAQAQLDAALANVERARDVRDAAERRAAQARADRARARDQLDKTAITSPISGVVTRLNVAAGEMVVVGVQNQPGTTLMTVSDMASINAEVKVAEADVMRLSPGMTATVSLEAVPGRRYSGRIVEIGASALPQLGAQAAAREFKVKVRLDDTAASLRPGLTCDVDIVAAEKRGVLTVPLQAVVERDGARGIFIVDGTTARLRRVTTGIIGGLSIEVDGVADGTEIVSGPIQALRTLVDGTAIRRSASR